MKKIFISLSVDVIKFFIAYALFSYVISLVAENVPRSWDPTGIGMVAVIILFIGFVIGAYKIGASYSDKSATQDPGTIVGVFKRPVRSIKYGIISLAMNFLFLYLLMAVSDYLFHWLCHPRLNTLEANALHKEQEKRKWLNR